MGIVSRKLHRSGLMSVAAASQIFQKVFGKGFLAIGFQRSAFSFLERKCSFSIALWQTPSQCCDILADC